MVKPSLIVFDWDLTLWNSWELHIQGLWHVADHLGLPRPLAEAVAPRYSVPFADHVAGVFPGQLEAAMACYLEFYDSRVRELGYLYDGVAEALGALRAHGYSLALLSDKRRVYGESEVELSGLGWAFDMVLFLKDGRPYKPDPEGLERVLRSLDTPREQALLVGDSHVDIACAQRAGVACAAALWGSVNREATLSWGPDYVWNTVAEMGAALTNTCQ